MIVDKGSNVGGRKWKPIKRGKLAPKAGVVLLFALPPDRRNNPPATFCSEFAPDFGINLQGNSSTPWRLVSKSGKKNLLNKKIVIKTSPLV